MAELTSAQHRAALSKAAEARRVRAELLASVTADESRSYGQPQTSQRLARWPAIDG